MQDFELTIQEAAEAIRRGVMTAVSYAESLIDRAEQAGELNAFIFCDVAQVLNDAWASDQIRKRRGVLGPLHGVPIALKDNIDTAMMPTTGGTSTLLDHVPKQNAVVTQKLIDAGAIIFGKANLHELASGVTSHNRYFGAVRNPYDSTRIPGGSSGGVAAAVAAGVVPGGIGTDTGGSVRIPSALCGIVGFRPTSGRWSQQGILPVSHTRDTAGPMARTVADCQLLDSVVTGDDATGLEVSMQGLRLGVPRAHFWDDLETQTACLMENVLVRLRDAGAVLIEADIDDIARLDYEAGFPIALHETVGDLNAYLAAHQLPVDYQQLVAQCDSPDVRKMLQSLAGEAAISTPVYRHARDVLRPQLQMRYRDYFAEHDVAAIIFPTTPLPAARIGEDETLMLNGEQKPTFLTFIRNTSPASVAGIAGITLPVAQTDTGLPLGLEIDTLSNHDAVLMAIARAMERILPALPPPSFGKPRS